jgi:transposase-like protein
MSLNAIRRHLKQMHRNYPSDSTVYEWIDRFTKEAVDKIKDYQPEVGDVWVADETVLKIGCKKVWFWDLIDTKTRYLLASHLSTSRNQYDARLLMARAAKRAGKRPKTVITDQLASYIEGVGWNFGDKTEHIASKKLTATPGTQLIERFHSTLKARTKVMRGLKSLDSARDILQGWLVHYNYLRPHEALKGRTPAQKAELKYPFKNWLDIVRSHKVSKPANSEHQSRGSVELPSAKMDISRRVRITEPRPRITQG